MKKVLTPKRINSPAVDVTWLREQLSTHLWRDDEVPGKITTVKIGRVVESPKRISITYDAEVCNKNKTRQSQTLLGIIPQYFDQELELIRRRKLIQPPVGKAMIILPAANLILLGFPNDRHLYLPSGSDVGDWLSVNLDKVATATVNNLQWKVEDVTLEPLRYVPGKRFTARCRAMVKNGKPQSEELTFIAKQLKEKAQAKILFENLHILPKIWKDNLADMNFSNLSETDFNIPVRIPRPYAFDEKQNIVYLEDLPGKNLEAALPEIDLSIIMPKAGKLLANFHQACKPVRKIITFESELKTLKKNTSKIVKRLPSTKSRIDKLLLQFEALPKTDNLFITLLHGTFRLNHLFVHQNELALLDLDSVCMGYPAVDVANFISALYFLEAQGRISQSQRQEITHYFLDGYLENSDWPVSVEILLWYLASLLIHKQALKYVKYLHSDREEKVNRMLMLAEDVLNKSRQELPKEAAGDFVCELLP